MADPPIPRLDLLDGTTTRVDNEATATDVEGATTQVVELSWQSLHGEVPSEKDADS